MIARAADDALRANFPESVGTESTSSAFVQLAYPWLVTTRSQALLESLEPPDGTLAGVLSRNALVRGTFTSATKVTPRDIVDLHPVLPTEHTTVPDSRLAWGPEANAKPLVTRVSLFGFTPSGIRLLSDVTTYPGEAYRPARINRLVSVVSRTARHFGQDHVFSHNGPRLWAELERTLRQLMTRLFSFGALDGATPGAAFDVRCNRGTMTQSDLDAGRVIASVGFSAAAVIERIKITLSLQTSAADRGEVEALMMGSV